MAGKLSPFQVAEAGHTGDSALIERAYAHSDPELRALALGSFHRLSLLTAERLRVGFADDTVSVRRRAAELSHRIDRSEELVDDLIALLADANEVAEVAAFSLGEIGDSNATKALQSMALDHDDALCREQAVASLGALHEGLETILAAMDDKATVRRRAVIALAPFDGPEVEAALARALEDRDWQVRQAAEDQLAPDA